MQPFYFGTSEKPLFGIHHPASFEAARPWGVVLCHPMGREYVVAHRSLRELAGRLARSGFHVLRFDFFGCGDSSGADEDGSIIQWKEDIAIAIDEIKDQAGVDKVALVGLRLGASLCCLAGIERADAEVAVFWEPIVNGRRYVDELLLEQDARLRAAASPFRPSRTPMNHAEILGFAVSQEMRHELESLDLLTLEKRPASRVLMIENVPRSGPNGFREKLEHLDAQTDFQFIDTPKAWRKGEMNRPLVPIPVLDAIQTWLSECCI
jgi:pimeloyl-ACP methyl ester carboxylesterase